MRKLGRQLLAGPYLVWMIGFILLPIVIILYYAFTNASGTFTWDNIAAIADPVHVKSILLSLKLGFFCTIVCLLLAYPLAMILNSFHFKHQSFVVFLFVLPMWMNFMLRILAWRLLLSNNGIVNALFGFFGFGPVKMLNTPTAVVFGMVYDFLPFMILPLYTQLVKLDNRLLEAASDLGAGPIKSFFTITLPLSKTGIIAGSMLVFVPAVGEFVIPELVGGSENLMIGKVLWQAFFDQNNWPLASAVAVVMVALLVVPIALFQHYENRELEEGSK